MSEPVDHPGNIYQQWKRHLLLMKQRHPSQFEGQSISLAWPDGWHPLVERVCAALHARDPQVRWVQIKEKYGSLRMYFAGQPFRADVVIEHKGLLSFYSRERDRSHDPVLALIMDAEKESLKTCCRCSAPGHAHIFEGWVLTVCEACTPIIQAYRTSPLRRPDP